MMRYLAFFLFASSAFAQCTGFGFSKTVDIDRSKVPTTQSSFTVLIDKTDAGLATVANGGNVTSVSSGIPNDLVFCDLGDSALMNWEVDAYDATTGRIRVWVLVGTVNGVAALADTQFHINAGKASVTTYQGGAASASWDANYLGVWHAGTSTTLSLTDSKGLSTATNHSATAVAGQINGAFAVASASSQYVDLGGASTLNTSGQNVTIEAWVNPTTNQAFQRVISKLDANAGYELYLGDGTAANSKPTFQLKDGSGNLSYVRSATNAPTATWTHVVVTATGSTSGLLKSYVNGVSTSFAASGNSAATWANSSTTALLGKVSFNSTTQFNGGIDEVRISQVARSADWITAEYNNQNAPSTFLAINTNTDGPTISAVTLSANGPTSVKATWTTATNGATSGVSSSQLTCTASGTTYTTPEVNPVQVGTGNFWGVTAHSVVLTGLPTNTSRSAYTCTVLSRASNGGAASASAGTAGTAAALTTTAMQVSWISAPIRTNDQYNGAHGMPNTSYWQDGDTQYCTWSDDDYQYCIGGDAKGVCTGATETSCQARNSTTGNGTTLSIMRTSSPYHITYEQVGGELNYRYSTSTYGSLWGSVGMLSVGGTIYMGVDTYNSSTTGFSMVKSTDHWLTSVAPHHNVGPDTNTVTAMSCSSGTVTVTSKLNVTDVSFSAANGYTPTLKVVVAGASPSGWNGTFSVTGSTASGGAGGLPTISYSQTCPSAWTSGGTVGVYGMDLPTEAGWQVKPDLFLMNFIQCDGRDYVPKAATANGCTPFAGMDGWIYTLVEWGPAGVGRRCDTNDPRGNPQCVMLFRMRIEDLPLQQFSKWQAYTGTQTGDDGLYDSNWTTTLANATGLSPLIYYGRNLGAKPAMVFIKDFNRFIMAQTAAHSFECTTGGGMLYEAQYPWSVPKPIASLNRDVSHFTSYMPMFPQPLPATYTQTSSSPLTAVMGISTSGTCNWLDTSVGGASDNYTAWPRQMILTAATPTRSWTPKFTTGGAGHVRSGLDVFYDFQGITGQTSAANLSPNDTPALNAGSCAAPPCWNWTGFTNTSYLFLDQYGLYNFGAPGALTTVGQAWTSPTNYAWMSAYAQPLNDFTAEICFGHYPGTSIQPISSDEVVLSKLGDLVIQRSGSTANTWSVTVKGTAIGTLTVNDGAFGCMVVRRSGSGANNVTAYTAAGITGTLPLSGGITGTATGQWGTAPLMLGSPSCTVAAATNTNPIAITCAAAHDLRDGEPVTITGVGGNTAANTTGYAKVTGATIIGTQFSLYSDRALTTGVAGNGAYTSGGTLGGNSLRGIVSQLAVWNRALTDAEIVREIAATRSDLKRRGPNPPAI